MVNWEDLQKVYLQTTKSQNDAPEQWVTIWQSREILSWRSESWYFGTGDLYKQHCYLWSILILKSVYCKGSSEIQVWGIGNILGEGSLIQQYYYHLAINHLRVGNWKFDTRISSSDHGIQIDRNSPGHHSASSLIRSLTCSLNYMKAISIGLIINLYPYLKSAHTDHAPTFCTLLQGSFLLQSCKHTFFHYSTFTGRWDRIFTDVFWVVENVTEFESMRRHQLWSGKRKPLSLILVDARRESYHFLTRLTGDLLAKTMSAWTVFSKVYRNGMLAMSFEEPKLQEVEGAPMVCQWFSWIYQKRWFLDIREVIQGSAAVLDIIVN